MAAPVGNQFWKQRSKHGRDKIFATPEMLWQEACAYFESIDSNPFTKVEAKTVNIGDFQSKIELAKMPVMKPYTIQGLTRYLDCNTHYLYHFEDQLKGKTDELSEGFRQILTRIREIIYEQKYSGAASGFFNGNLITRDLGIADKKEIDKTLKKVNFTDAG